MNRRYRAFLSYSHKDSQFAAWLHKELERWKVDSDLVGRKTVSGEVPKSLRPIFRDREDFAGGASLKSATEAALRESDFLVVICSPNSSTSAYVDAEVRFFKCLGRADRIIPVILAGEPGDSEHECFPPSVKYVVDKSGELTPKLAEPIAADAREIGDGRPRAAAKVAAGLLGLSFDEIARRAERAQRRKIRIFGAIASSMAVLAVVAGIFAWLAEMRRIEAQENYAAAKTAAVDLLEGVAKDISGNETTLPMQRRMLTRADSIFEILESREPDDLEVIASRARTLGIFAGSFRDRGDWDAAARNARRSEALINRLLDVGDKTENWLALRTAARMLLITALEQSEASDAKEVERLRRSLRKDMQDLRDSGTADHETVGMIGAHYFREALSKHDAGETEAAAALLSEGVEALEAFDKPDFEDHRETPKSKLTRASLDHKARILLSAGMPERALVAAQRLEAFLEQLLKKAPEPEILRGPVIDAAFQKYEILTALGRHADAARGAWRGHAASYGAVPLRDADPVSIRAEADMALAEGDKLLSVDDRKQAMTQLQLCASLFHRLLKLPESRVNDGVQFIRCLSKIEETLVDDAIGRSAALDSSVAEAEALAKRFADLLFFEGLARMRRGFAYHEAGVLEKAVDDFQRAGDIFSRQAEHGGARESDILSMAGDAYFNAGNIQKEIGYSSKNAFSKAVEVYERAVGLDPTLLRKLKRAQKALGD